MLNQHFLFKFSLLQIIHLLGHTLVISLLEAHDVCSTFLGLLNLFPSAHFLLLEQGNTVGKHIGIFLNTILKEAHSLNESPATYSKRSFFAAKGVFPNDAAGP